MVSYVLPLRSSEPIDRELDAYLQRVVALADLIVVDGSPQSVFDQHARRWNVLGVQHVAIHTDFARLLNGKVAGVLTGVRLARHECVIIADDDVRYDDDALERMEAILQNAEVVRPQNYFDPMPWHACVDTARTLLNRMTGGDWPGTIGVRRSALLATGGYDGDVLFENLELVRTITAAGGREQCALDLYVPRLPPSTARFWSQRARQAYDEFARPGRLALWLAVVPAMLALAAAGRWKSMAAAVVTIVAIAETGRRRKGGSRVFPIVASIAAPVWVLERGVCAWLAVGARLVFGGIPYRGQIISRAATPLRVLARRHRIGPEVAS